jgi:hypothetical protein
MRPPSMTIPLSRSVGRSSAVEVPYTTQGRQHRQALSRSTSTSARSASTDGAHGDPEVEALPRAVRREDRPGEELT